MRGMVVELLTVVGCELVEGCEVDEVGTVLLVLNTALVVVDVLVDEPVGREMDETDDELADVD